LIELRRAHPALSIGPYTALDVVGEHALSYQRRHGDERLSVVLNLGSLPERVKLGETGHILVSTCLDREGEHVDEILMLRPDEGVILSHT
jgi:hypothetical protein